jgi:rubrerythrin
VTTNLLDAVRVVKENERTASQHYAEAAQIIKNPIGQKLFSELSKFENYHLAKLTALELSLQENGGFINYVGKSFPLPPKFEIKAAKDLNNKSAMQIITEARDLEKLAEKSYADLAAQVTEPEGRQMFFRLSEEEHNHYRILTEAYWSLNDKGVWSWSRI